MDTQEDIEFRPEQFIAQHDTVIVLGRFVMRVKATDREFTSDWAHCWTIRSGRVTRFREYVDTAAVTSARGAGSSSSNLLGSLQS